MSLQDPESGQAVPHFQITDPVTKIQPIGNFPKYSYDTPCQSTICTLEQQQIISSHPNNLDESAQLLVSKRSTEFADKISNTWAIVASRIPALRTTIQASGDGTYYQTIFEHANPLKLNRHSTLDVKDGAYLEIITEYEESTVLLHIHRALVDQTSITLIGKEFSQCWNDLVQEQGPSIEAYRNHHSFKTVDTSAKYWKDLFLSVGSEPRLHSFPLDRQWPRSETTLTIPQHLFEMALQFRDRYDIRLDDLAYGIWAIVSTRHVSSGERTAVFGVTARDRTFYGHDRVVGLVDQEFPLVLSVPGDMDALSWIRHVGNVTTKTSAHAHIGYKTIMETTSGVHPQVKVSINLTDDNQNVMNPDDDFALVLNISASAELKLSMRHNQTVPRADVQILLDHVAATLKYIIENPQASVSTIDIMSPAERQVLHEYGKSAFKARSGLVHSLVEQQAKLTPDAEAIQFEMDAALTYSMLNRRSNRLARLMRKYGASYVAVHMHPSADFIVALLAILKAGAAYVILDPGAVPSRKSFIIEDIQTDIVLVDKNTAGQLGNEYKIGDLLSQCIDKDDSDLSISQPGSDIAYVIYTSGSTSKPKAVQLEHQAAFNGLLAFPKIKDLRQLLFFNPVFSAAQRSIWATLSIGGCLCLASKDNLTLHAARVIDMMHVNSVDMTSTTAALISSDEVPSLRRMALGGEMVNPAVIQKWAHRVELLSSYGLSECTQLNWRYRLKGDVSAQVIGQSFDTTTCYILTPGTTTLSPLLVPGELCLGGAQLARGYLNDPEETQRRFIRNPFGQGRLYRTGDMAVRRGDGSIELIGRIDFQAKINGQRVDPGEPNAIIQLHEKVQGSAVVPAVVGNKTALVAAIVSCAEDSWESLVDNLRSFLATKVPLYMIPSFWVPMSVLPLNANGKVDISAIRDIVEGLVQSGQLRPNRPKTKTDEPVLTDNENIMRKLWAEFLSIPESEIFLEDSFVSLGGSSLEAIQVVSRLQFQHSLILRVEDIILNKSLSGVANLVQQQTIKINGGDNTATTPFLLLREPASLDQSGINMSDIEDAFPVTPFQEAVIANTMMGGTNYVYSRSYSFNGYTSDAVKDSLTSLMTSDRYLRTTFFPEGSSFTQVVRKTIDIPWETSDMDLKEYVQQQVSKPMYSGELWWRAAALPGNVLVLTIHHALFDYWSSEFLPQDISSLLLGTARVQRPIFSHYVEYLHQHDGVTMHKFWEAYLDGAQRPVLGGSLTAPENTATAKLDCDLKSTASKLNVTPSVLVYAAWSVVLAVTGSTNDVVMGVTLSGRDVPVPGILEMNGPTLQIAPLRVKVDRASSFEAKLSNLGERCIGCFLENGRDRIYKNLGEFWFKGRGQCYTT